MFYIQVHHHYSKEHRIKIAILLTSGGVAPILSANLMELEREGNERTQYA